MNWRCVRHDLVEAKEQIEQIIAKLDAGEPPSEGGYLVMIQHAFHHLNIAWNARRCALEKYQQMSTRDFNRWRKFPQGVEWEELHRTNRSTVPSKAAADGDLTGPVT